VPSKLLTLGGVQVPTRLTPWPQDKLLRASINNFGIGGTNAHIIVEGPPSSSPRVNGVNGHASHQDVTQTSDRHWIHILSASDSSSCLEMAKNLSTYLRRSIQDCNEPSLSDLAYTLSERRSRLPWALAVRARNVTELAERLTQPAVKALYSTKQPRLGFVFNGQGAQWHAMGRELISAYPVFGASIQKADQILREYGASWSLQGDYKIPCLSTPLLTFS
jgi:acyl transferase domain-containing protein